MRSTLSLLLKTLLPVAIGVAVVAWLMGSEFSLSQFNQIPWTGRTAFALALAALAVAGREFGMMWRWRIISDRRLCWMSAAKVTMLCEFTSAVTPTTAGGSALSMIFLNREGLTLGHATSLTMVALMLDELFIAIACPLLILFVPVGELFGFTTGHLASATRTAFWVVYGGVCGITLLLYGSAFVWPHKIAFVINKVFSLRWLRRWHDQAEDTGRNLVSAGRDLRSRRLGWWLEAMAATAISWVSRFLVVNALFIGFAPLASQAVVFGRQFVVWTLLTVSPTPGGSGISEWLFANFYGDLLASGSMTIVIAVIWRLMT